MSVCIVFGLRRKDGVGSCTSAVGRASTTVAYLGVNSVGSAVAPSVLSNTPMEF